MCNFIDLTFFSISFDRNYIVSLQESYGKFDINNALNLVPFIDLFGNGGISALPLKHDILNILLFFPLGVYLPILFKKSFKETLLIGLSASLLVEVSQLILSITYQFADWHADVTDVITNTLGVCVGYWLFVLYTKLKASL